MNAASWILLFTKWSLVLNSAACSARQAGILNRWCTKTRAYFANRSNNRVASLLLSPDFNIHCRFQWQPACRGASWMPIGRDGVSEKTSLNCSVSMPPLLRNQRQVTGDDYLWLRT